MLFKIGVQLESGKYSTIPVSIKEGSIADMETSTIPQEEKSDVFFVWAKALPMTLKIAVMTSAAAKIRKTITKYTAPHNCFIILLRYL